MEDRYKDFLKKYKEKKYIKKTQSEPSSPKNYTSSLNSSPSSDHDFKTLGENNRQIKTQQNKNSQINNPQTNNQQIKTAQISKPQNHQTNYQNNVVINQLQFNINDGNSYYDDNWKELDTLLLYQSSDFKFNSNIVIVELDNTLIKNISKKKLYENQFETDNKSIELYLDNTMRKFKSNDLSVIILSNQISTSDNNYDIIKLKIKKFIEKTHIPILSIFALRPNCFMKPHTKMWSLVKQYYKIKNKFISNGMVISNNGGIFIEKYHKKTDTITGKFISDDIDRAFAHNIGLQFISIENFLEITNNKSILKWRSSIIPPELRIDLIEGLRSYRNKDVFIELNKIKKSDSYLIIVFGAPCSGKTTLSREIVKKWRSSKINDTNAIKFYSNNKYSISKINNLTENSLNNRFSVLVDGEYPNNNYRKSLIEAAKNNNSSIIYIEVNPDFEISKLLNHVRVETSNDTKIELIPLSKFYEYRGKYIKPVLDEKSTYMLYRPNLIPTNILTKFRY
jgi:hypothetical protein